jgi:outer membrane protein
LRNDEAGFVLAVGHAPGPLTEAQAPLRFLPGSVDEAVAAAEIARPSVVQAAYLEKAAGNQIRSLTGQLLPQLSLLASLTRTADPAKRVEESTTNKIETILTVPIYESGNVRAEIRQAKENRQGLLENIEQARQQAQNDAVTAWSLYQTGRAQLQADTVQVESATIALQGTRAELQVGQRTELDVLTAIQTLLAAQVSVVSDKHDIVVYAYTLLATMGRLTADQIQIGANIYDVERHYNETNGKWLDIRVSREEGYAGYEVMPGQSKWVPDATKVPTGWLPTVVTNPSWLPGWVK